MSAKAALIEFLASSRIDSRDGGVWDDGAIVAFFATGTGTSKAVWLDRDKTLPTAAGIYQTTLGSDGSCVVFGDGIYDIKIYDSSDTGLATALKTFSQINVGDATVGAELTSLTLIDSIDPTKKGTFVVSSVTAGTTRTYSLPDVSGSLVVNGGSGLRIQSSTPYNTHVGQNAGIVSSGVSNTSFGYSSMLNTTTGVNNVSVGYNSMRSNTTGGSNTALGTISLYSCSLGNANVALGVAAGEVVTTGSGNVLIGRDAGNTNSPSGAITTEDNRICIGDNNITNAYTKVAWTVTSDARDKTDIESFNLGLEYIEQIRPVTFLWDDRSRYANRVSDGSKKSPNTNLGFIAQELAEIEESLGILGASVVDSENPDQLKITETKIIPFLVNAIKQLSARVAILEGA